MKHVQTLLTAAGLAPEKVTEVIGLADDAAFEPTELVAAIRANVETQIKNDDKFWEGLDEGNVKEPFRKKIEAQQYGRAANIVRQKTLKALGMKEEDFNDLPEEERKQLETFIPKAMEKYAATKAGDKELQAALVAERQKLEQLEASLPERDSAIAKKIIDQHNAEKLSYIVLSELAGVKGLKVPPAYIVEGLIKHLSDTAAFEINGFTAKPKQKANPALDMLEGAKVLTLGDLIVKKITADGLLEAQAVPPKKAGKVEIEPDETGGLAISSHIMEKINATLPADK